MRKKIETLKHATQKKIPACGTTLSCYIANDISSKYIV